jgi:hypothetical protein
MNRYESLFGPSDNLQTAETDKLAFQQILKSPAPRLIQTEER